MPHPSHLNFISINNRGMDRLATLTLFTRIVETGSFSQAAAGLDIPPVGCWVARVEPDEVADLFRFFALTEGLALRTRHHTAGAGLSGRPQRQSAGDRASAIPGDGSESSGPRLLSAEP